ncbi:MAG: hypothetical protein ABW137_05140 [Mycobacterium sp.]
MDDHHRRRLVIALPDSYESARRRYELLVPKLDDLAFAGARSWHQMLLVAQANAPHGFLRYYRDDLAATFHGSPSRWKATEYLMGNYALTETLFRRQPSTVLNGRLRTLIYVDPTGVTRLTVDQPSLQFASCDSSGCALGQRLDACLAHLIGLLGGQVPQQLALSVGEHYDVRPSVPTQRETSTPSRTPSRNSAGQ